MFNSSVLEVAIGLIFVYLLISVICTAINEGIASIFNVRGKNLFDGIKNLLNDPSFNHLAQQVYSHGLVDSISKEAATVGVSNRLPSYMPSSSFSLALLDLLHIHGTAALHPDEEVMKASTNYEVALAASRAKPKDEALASAAEAAKAVLDGLVDPFGLALPARSNTKPYDNLGRIVGDKLLDPGFADRIDRMRVMAVNFPNQLNAPMASFEAAVAQLAPGHTKETLHVLIEKTKRDVAIAQTDVIKVEHYAEALKANLETWFDDSMDRIGGWYKRWSKKTIMVASLVLVVALNADTIMIAKRLTKDGALRSAMVTAAQVASKPIVPPTSSNVIAPSNENAIYSSSNPQVTEVLKVASSLTLPIGWQSGEISTLNRFPTENPKDVFSWIEKIMGLMLTMGAASLGAPFWFDMLSKVINIRGSGTPPGHSKKNAPAPK